MSERVDRKLQEVPLAEYRYRHEAEFAAGFLSDAGIPFRLQFDDAGGADLGLSMSRPAVLWVRTVDAAAAREVVGLEETEQVAAPSSSMQPRRLPARQPRLAPLERVVSTGLAVALFSSVPYLPYGPFRSSVGLLCLGAGFAFLFATVVGRAPGPLERVIKMLAGSPPK
jgi:hypothetical protein